MRGLMDKKTLEDAIKNGLTIQQIAGAVNKSAGSVRHWLRKYGLSTVKRVQYICPCGETDPDQFYGHRKSLCKVCDNRRVTERNRKNKQEAVELMGGKCNSCGFDLFYEALEFHHLDPSEKDPKFTNVSNWGMERIKEELSKCVMLCSNCHKGAHAGHIKL
jgi:5-methylcytosine-specific restriction endonuclease McrA